MRLNAAGRDPDGSRIRRLPGLAEYGGPVLSPDGRWLALVRSSGPGITGSLYIARSDGSALRLVWRNGYDPSWSPDSKRLVFALDACADRGDACYAAYDHVADLGVVGVDGRGFRRLTRNRVHVRLGDALLGAFELGSPRCRHRSGSA